MAMKRKDFVALVLTHGRPDKIRTLSMLKKSGYTGPILIVVDNEDKTLAEYQRRYGAQVVVFDKAAVAEQIDEGDNFGDRRAIIYARCAAFEIAKQAGYRYFIQLDDDYNYAEWRFTSAHEYCSKRRVKCLDTVFDSLVEYLEATSCNSIAIAQGGDFIGGRKGKYGSKIFAARKAMNTFVCSVDRPFQFFGRINEDVNTYSCGQRRGMLFLTINRLSITQTTTQSSSGGMTELYLDSGTYVKSFYSVMYAPSCVSVAMMGDKHRRLHHRVNWECTAPKIVREATVKTL
jgi:hypothetical protein